MTNRESTSSSIEQPPEHPRSGRRAARIGGSLLTLASVLGLLTVVASSCRTEPLPSQAPALGASLELAAGEVVLVGDGGDTMLMSNTPLPIGARLRVGAGARALVRLGDGTRVFLRDNTTVTLGDALALESGHAWVDAPPLEQGQRAGVHSLGTVQVAVSDGGASLSRVDDAVEIYVAEGLAIVTAPGGRTEVEPGERALVSGLAAPTVEPVKFWDDWTGGMGDHSAAGSSSSSGPWIGTGSLYAIDHMAGPGAPALPLAIQRQSVEVAIDQQIAETEVEQVFFNPASGDVEGWYWFTVPEDAMLVGFALETDGELVEAEVVERKQATQTFEAAIVRRVDPALLEWIDARTVRARIYPIPGAGTRRVVLRYQQLLSESEGKLRYTYPMAAPLGREAATIEEFSLQVQLRGDLAERYGIATRNDARVEGENNRVTMRRSGFTPRADFELELTRKPGGESEPTVVRASVFEPRGDQADYVLLRWLPDIEFASAAVPKGEVVVVVDTSAGSDPGEHQTKLAVAEALLRSLSTEDEFVLVGADLNAEVLYPQEGMAKATPEAISAALEQLGKRKPGGATDMGAIFEQSVERVHGRTQPAIVYIGDGLATSGAIAGDAIAERLSWTLAGSPARLFTIAVGREVNDALLTRLARIGGGRSLRVEDPSEAVIRALELSGALKTPTLTNLAVDVGQGLDDVFASAEGKLSRGEELTILARTHHPLPENVKIRFSFAGETYERTYELVRDKDSNVLTRLVPRLWANAYVQSLLIDSRGPEAVRGKVLTLGIEYGLMTPFTSFLALESDAAYRRAGIERRRREFPVLTADAGALQDEPAVERESPTILSMIGAAASAPFGCVVAPPEDRQREEQTGASEDRPAREQARAQTRGPAPSSGTPTDARLEPTPEPADATVEEDGNLGGQGAAIARKAGSLGVVKLDAESFDGLADDRAGRLAAAGYQVAAPPAWVDEVTESELARRSLNGRAPVLYSSIPRDQSFACSDASTRGLAHRRLLWGRRLDRQTGMAGMLRVYEASLAACELQRWRDQQAFLDLLQARARTEAEIQLLLGHFYMDADARLFLVAALQRRLIEPQLIAAVNYAIHGGIEPWWEIDRQLDVTDDPHERLRILDAALINKPGDPDGERRMLAELVAQDRRDDAIARGLRLRDHGQMTPELAVLVGELLVAAKREDAAKRLYSELVEFAPDQLDSRRLLGDIFMRHGWSADAYRQYELLFELTQAPEDAIRMARAAASTDEALRLLGRVQSGEGRPGEDDPRRFARLHAAVLLAILIDTKAHDLDKLEARLEALNLFEGPGTWELLLWSDFGAALTLASEDQKAIVQADGVDASDTGLFARQYAGGVPNLVVRHSGLVPDRAVAWERITLRWDGEAFKVSRSQGMIEAKVARAAEPAIIEENEAEPTE
ncbi:MAG TPA: VIT domain-containing protein [Enhygromyxa sp.]|nr:VIT domain-containing protein [Enhygromyxa sp.]